MEKIRYRKLGKNDLELIVEYRVIFLRELQGQYPAEVEGKLREALTSYFQKALNDRSFIGWVAEDGTKPVGFGGMVIHQIPGNLKLVNGWGGYVLNMYTVPGYRKKGICNEILNRFIDEGKRLGLCKIYLNASGDGMEIYRKNGFTEPDLKEMELKLT